jgi:hypothetical protein|nr:MAG TPA: hypothetical protein [Caudoviricetes sp.]
MTNNATMIPKTKITYQEWFLEQKTRCISQAEELDDAIEMANSGDAYNMEGMKVKYADFMVYAVKALILGISQRVRRNGVPSMELVQCKVSGK